MLRKRRTVPLRRTLHVEALEDRTLMTGNVTVFLDLGGTLHITGDGGGLNSSFREAVQILDTSPPGLPNLSFRVQGKPGTFTSVNGVQFIDFVGSSIQSVVANFPSFGPATFNELDIIGAFPSAPTSGTSFPGAVTVSGGAGSTNLSISNITTNNVTLAESGSTSGAAVTLNSVKAGLLTTFTGSGADTYSISGGSYALANLNTDGGNDGVTIAGSSIGSLTANSTNGNDTYNVSGNSLSKALLSVGSTGAGTGDDSVTFSGNTILSSATINVGVGNTAAPRAVTLGGHLVTVNGNAVALGGLTVAVGDTASQSNGAPSLWATTQVAVDANKVAGLESVSVGTWAYTTEINNNTAGALTATVGNHSGTVYRPGTTNGPTAPPTPAIGVNISNDTIAGLLSATVGLFTGAAGDVGGTIGVNLNQDTAKFLALNVGDGTNSAVGTTISETVNVSNINLTGASPVANTINIGFNPVGNVGLNSRSLTATINTIQSLGTPLLVQISAGQLGGLGANLGGGGNVTLNSIVTDELDAFIGNNFSNVALTNSSSIPDANGGGNMSLTLGTANGGGMNVTVMNDNIGNGATGTLSLVKTDTITDLTQWLIQNIKTFDFTMSAGDGTGGTNIATLNNINVTDFMLLQFGNGFNGVQATGLVVSPGFGIINGGGNPGSVFIGSPTNLGFVTFGFGAYF